MLEKISDGISIPSHIWNNPRLSLQDKLVWAIMHSNGRENFNIEDTSSRLKTSPEQILSSVNRLFEQKLIKETRYV